MDDSKTNSILKAINYDEFIVLLGTQKINEFIEGIKPTSITSTNEEKESTSTSLDEHNIICFIADWSVPSRNAMKKIKKKNIQKSKVGIIDVDLVDSIDMCDYYEVKAVPHFILFKDKEPIMQFSGCRLEMIDEAFAKIEVKGRKETNEITAGMISSDENKKCMKGHELEFLAELPAVPYTDGYFYCNGCKKIIKCTEKEKVGHCGICDYDVCVACVG